MTKESSGLFHDQLLAFLQDDLQKKKEEGWDAVFDPQLRDYGDAISRSIRSTAPMPLDEIIERYQHLFVDRAPMQLEQQMLRSLGAKNLRIYRGLPRLYRQSQMNISKVKPQFTHLPSLLKTAAAKTIYSLYSGVSIPPGTKMAILTWVIPDGLGDFLAAQMAAREIQRAFPTIDLKLYVISEQALALPEDLDVHFWNGSDEQIKDLRASDLILEISTFYPETEKIQKQIEALHCDSPQPQWEMIGEYGYLESDWFHPRSGRHCMGLHFLEKGIMIRENKRENISELSHEALCGWLFGQIQPSFEQIERYRQNHRFFLGYLFSPEGIFVYLHAVIKSLEMDTKDIDICMPDATRMLAYFDERLKSGLGPIENKWGIQKIVLCIGSHTAEWKLNENGKVLRILCPDLLKHSDFQKLLSWSENFVACRGNQSLSEAISQNKCFFYDPREHNRYFIKDLIALAENRLKLFPSTIGILHLFARVMEHHLPSQEGEWIEETGIRSQKMELIEIAEQMGTYLQDPQAFLGFKHLGRIIAEEHSCNDFILHLVERAICHRHHPEIAKIEEEEMNQFVHGRRPLFIVIERLRQALIEL